MTGKSVTLTFGEPEPAPPSASAPAQIRKTTDEHRSTNWQVKLVAWTIGAPSILAMVFTGIIGLLYAWRSTSDTQTWLAISAGLIAVTMFGAGLPAAWGTKAGKPAFVFWLMCVATNFGFMTHFAIAGASSPPAVDISRGEARELDAEIAWREVALGEFDEDLSASASSRRRIEASTPEARERRSTLAGELSALEAKRHGTKPGLDLTSIAFLMLMGSSAGMTIWAAVRASILAEPATASAAPGVPPALPASQWLPAPASFQTASAVKLAPVRWLWPSAIPAGALSLIAGEAGVGKSTIAASIAGIVSSGGSWPSGERAEAGGVIFCEGEDDRSAVTAPRLAAAGANMRRIVLGPVCDLSAGVGQLQEAARSLSGGASLIVLSPIRSFFGLESYRSGDVRARLAPLLAWAEAEGIAVLGVSHPKTGARDFAGSSAWKEVARAGLFAEKTDDGGRHVTPLKASLAPDGWRLPYRIEAVEAGGIHTSRIAWQPEDAPTLQLAPANSSRNLSAAEVQSWLAGRLASGPRDGAALKAAAAAAGIPRATLYRNADELGVTRRSVDGSPRKTWELKGPG